MRARVLGFLRQPWATAENRTILLVQMVVIVGTSVLLTLGYEAQREIRLILDQRQGAVLISGWDGLAWIVWPLSAPAMLLLIRRFPMVRGQIAWGVSRLILSSIGLFVFVTNLRFALRVLPRFAAAGGAGVPIDSEHYFSTTLALLPVDFLTFYGFFSATFAIDYYFKHRRRQDEAMRLRLRAHQLESELANAELRALRGQLHPHFLFNSFNAVTTLVRQHRNDAAVEVIAQLSTLLRLAIQRTGQQELTLEEELDFIRRYLAIEHLRFGDKLQLEFAVEPETLQTRVPNLLVQPFVENAIKHGISRRTSPGRIEITARFDGDRLEVIVENDGPEVAPTDPRPRTGGIGLSNTRTRLDKIYGATYRLDLIHRNDGGMRARLLLPRHSSLFPLQRHDPDPHVDRR